MAFILAKVESFRVSGNDAFKRGQPAEAFAHYRAGIQDLLQCGACPEANSASSVLWSNIAACHLQTGDYAAALESSTAALLAQPKFVKALYRRAQARRALGDLPGALSDAEAARAVEPGNSAVVDLVYDLEDEIAAQPRGRAGGGGASGATAARQKGGAKAGGESSKGSEEGGEQEGPQGPSEAEISFAFGVIDELRESLSCAADAPTQITLMHTFHPAPSAAEAAAGETGPRIDVGRIGIEGAFASADSLESALSFARGQHMTVSAECAVVVAAKSKIKYPLAWWAGDWPFSSLEQEGVFVELHTRHGAEPVTWFLPEGYGLGALGEPVKLSPDCGLLVDMRPIFPRRAA